LNIARIFSVFKIKCGKFNNPNVFEQHYYVQRPHVLVEEAPHVVDIIQPTFESLQVAPISKDPTKEEMCLRSLLSLPHLLARCTQGKNLLIDYSQSHVMTTINYLSVITKKNH
jgi:hypothetical protein